MIPSVLGLVARVRFKPGKGSTCPCCRRRIRGPFATALVYKAGSAEPNLVAAICTNCASTTEEPTAGEALAPRVWQDG